MRKIMTLAAAAGWAVAGVLLGVQAASAAPAHHQVPRWLVVYPPRALRACSGGTGVVVFDRQTFVERAIVCRDGQVFVAGG